MQNNEYWQQRAENNLIDAENLTTEQLKKLKVVFQKAANDIQDEIFKFYGKYSSETGLSLIDINKRLNKDELATFGLELKRYLNEVYRLGGYSPNTREYLRSLSARTYMSRLEYLKAEIQWIIENMYRYENLMLTELFQKAYDETYFKRVFDIQQGLGFAFEFGTLSVKKIKAAINQNWQGSNFSDRIWIDKNKLLQVLEQRIPQAVAIGQGSKTLARNLSKLLDTKYSNAERLARTEMNKIANDAAKMAYDETPDEVLQQYKILATLDNRTSEICQHMDGKIFKLSEYEVGVTAPPFHVRCRTTTIPYFKDNVSEHGRIATDYSTGNAYYVPSDMTYKEWRDNLTEKQEKYFIANQKMREQRKADKEQLAKYRKLVNKANKTDNSEFFAGFPTRLEEFQQMKYLEPSKWEVYKKNAQIIRNID